MDGSESTGYGFYDVSGDGYFYDTLDGMGYEDELDRAIYCGSDYWCASPHQERDTGIVQVSTSESGSLYCSEVNYGGWNGIRPLVSIPLSKIGKGITITENYFNN